MEPNKKSPEGANLRGHGDVNNSQPQQPCGGYPPDRDVVAARLRRIERGTTTMRFYHDVERAVREADMAARAHFAALCDGDMELAEATRRRFLALCERAKEARH